MKLNSLTSGTAGSLELQAPSTSVNVQIAVLNQMDLVLLQLHYVVAVLKW